MIDRATSERLEDIVSMLITEIGDDDYENRTFLRHLVEKHGASLVFSTLRDEAAKALETAPIGSPRADGLLRLYQFYSYVAKTAE